MELDARKFRILQAIIDDYILTASPVGSRTIARKYMELSSATIRNEMSDLEEMGFLEQPHTSAGRVPSLKAYRLYVDHIMKESQLTAAEAKHISGFFDKRVGQVQDVLGRAAQVLSDVTQYTALVLPPQMPSLRIQRVQLVPVASGAALVVAVMDAGIVKDAIIRVPEALTDDHLYGISRMLTKVLENRRLDELPGLMKKVSAELDENWQFLQSVIEAIGDKAEHDRSSMWVSGPTNLLSYPEYSDVQKARAFLSVLEDRDKLYGLMAGGNMQITVRIGAETDIPEMSDCSLVTATYTMGDQRVGNIGVIGPVRMKYRKVLSVLDYMGKCLSEMLET